MESFCTAQEVQDDASNLGMDDLENLKEKRKSLQRNAKDPLDNVRTCDHSYHHLATNLLG